MAERQTENKVEAAGNNLPALTDYNDGKMFKLSSFFSIEFL